jgi:hypothetical protein
MEMLVVGGTEDFVITWQAIPELPHLFYILGITSQNIEFCLRGHIHSLVFKEKREQYNFDS